MNYFLPNLLKSSVEELWNNTFSVRCRLKTGAHVQGRLLCLRLDTAMNSDLCFKAINFHCLGPYTSQIICLDSYFSCSATCWFSSAVTPIAGQPTFDADFGKTLLVSKGLSSHLIQSSSLKAEWTHLRPLTFLCSTEKLKVRLWFCQGESHCWSNRTFPHFKSNSLVAECFGDLAQRFTSLCLCLTEHPELNKVSHKLC